MYPAFCSFCVRHKVKLLVVGLLLILAVIFFLRLGTFPSDEPRDRELEASFREHRQAFEILCAMALEDSGKVDYISLETLREEDKLDSRRRAKYKDLLNEIKLVENIKVGDHDVVFEYRAGGLLAIGPSWGKGIIFYSGEYLGPIGRVVDDLDDLGDRNGTCVKPLEKNWYLIYQNFGDY